MTTRLFIDVLFPNCIYMKTFQGDDDDWADFGGFEVSTVPYA
jgi:hypothetical protein